MTSQGQAPDLLGQSESLLAVKERLSQAARVDRPVLILGQRGTGKELAAARLHFLSRRWQGPYVTLNCAALAPGLLDAELFGHEAGAFTGAARRRRGRFEAADGGTLFLDEISHLSLGAQARILRVVEYGGFQPVGGTSERAVDVRVIAATNADLRRMCRLGSFLPDLWDRLSFEVLTLPPLRDRPGDVSFLAHFFAARMAQELGLSLAPVFSQEALALLDGYPWPGNVRELKNVAERAVYRWAGTASGTVGPEFLSLDTGVYLPEEAPPPDGLPRPEAAGPAGPRLPLAPGQFDEFLRREGLGLIERSLREAGHNQVQAAALLGLSYHRFRSLRRKFSTCASGCP